MQAAAHKSSSATAHLHPPLRTGRCTTCCIHPEGIVLKISARSVASAAARVVWCLMLGTLTKLIWGALRKGLHACMHVVQHLVIAWTPRSACTDPPAACLPCRPAVCVVITPPTSPEGELYPGLCKSDVIPAIKDKVAGAKAQAEADGMDVSNFVISDYTCMSETVNEYEVRACVRHVRSIARSQDMT